MRNSKKSKMSKPEISDRALANRVKRALEQSTDPELQALAPHTFAGLKVIHSMFEMIDAAKEVKTPRGISLGSVEVRAKDGDEKALKAIACANWMLDMVTEYVDTKKETAGSV